MTGTLDRPMMFCWVAIVALGTVMVASASIAISPTLLQKHLMFLAAGLGAMLLVLCVPLEWWRRGHRLAWLAAVAMCVLVLVPGVGIEANGARRWIGLGGFSLQAAEVCKFLLLVYLAGYLERFHGQIADDVRALLRPVLMLGVLAALLLVQPDFGTVVVLAAVTAGLLFIAGARLRHFLLISSVGVLLVAVLAVTQPYRMQRLISFIDPWQFAYGSGYQLTQALIAFGRGETFGLGLGEGIQKLFYLPEAHNDFIFAVIAEELGLVGALAVILLFLAIGVLGMATAAHAPDRFGMLVAMGITAWILVQAFMNIGVALGLLPVTGVPLPFLSSGGSSLIVTLASFGILMNIARHAR